MIPEIPLDTELLYQVATSTMAYAAACLGITIIALLVIAAHD